MPFEKGKWLEFHDGQYQFKLSFMLYVDLQTADKQNRETLNQMKTHHNGKTLYTEKIRTHILPGWSVHSTFGQVLNPMKMCRGKYCVEKLKMR